MPTEKPEAMIHGALDGYGRYGIVEVTEDGHLLCVECGWVGVHLGLHVWRAHGLRAAEYRERHGLRRTVGLVAPALHEQISATAAAGLAARPEFLARRDPGAALAARWRLGKSPSAEAAAERDARMSQVGRRGRRAVVLTCPECGTVWCPLGDHRRTYCTKSCASVAGARTRGHAK